MEKQRPYLEQWKAWREQGDKEAQRALIEHYLPLVDRICARFFVHSSVEREDFRSVGILGLLDSMEKFDYGSDVQFETYATWRIRGSILDQLRKDDHVPRKIREKARQIEAAYAFLEQENLRSVEDEEICRYLEMTPAEFSRVLLEISAGCYLSLDDGYEQEPRELADEQAVEPGTRVEQLYVQEVLAAAIQRLPEKERLVLSLFYYEELRPQEIAQVMGLSASRISQLHTKAIFRLRGMLSRKKKELYE